MKQLNARARKCLNNRTAKNQKRVSGKTQWTVCAEHPTPDLSWNRVAEAGGKKALLKARWHPVLAPMGSYL